jgi:hypothetical protein
VERTGCGETLEETFEPLLPVSEQFKLQKRRAMATSGVPFADFAFLQQSGRFDIGQELSPACIPAPVAPPNIGTTKITDVSHCLIIESNYIYRSVVILPPTKA